VNFLTQHTTFSPLMTQLETQSFQLSSRITMNSLNTFGGSFPTLIVVAIVSFILALFLMATLWPREKSDSMHSRQRRYGRVDGLFFKVQAAVLSLEDAERYLSDQSSSFALLQGVLMMNSQSMTLVSLSIGGCAFVSPTPLKKGSFLLLQLGSLPDFPQKNLIVGCRVIWSKKDKGTHGEIESAGCKFIFPQDSTVMEGPLKEYITFLMDEPVS